MIKLNVGGLKINTTRQVLLRNGENYFNKLLGGQIPVLRGKFNCCNQATCKPINFANKN